MAAASPMAPAGAVIPVTAGREASLMHGALKPRMNADERRRIELNAGVCHIQRRSTVVLENSGTPDPKNRSHINNRRLRWFHSARRNTGGACVLESLTAACRDCASGGQENSSEPEERS
jgi:hypothetical protein